MLYMFYMLAQQPHILSKSAYFEFVRLKADEICDYRVHYSIDIPRDFVEAQHQLLQQSKLYLCAVAAEHTANV